MDRRNRRPRSPGRSIRTAFLSFAIAFPLLLLVGVMVYYIPPVHDRLAWRVDELQAQIKYSLNPPEEVVFVPAASPVALTSATPTATTSPTATASPTQPGPTETPAPSPTPTFTPTPLPEKVLLTGIRHEYQRWNNCGPANLAMNLSYWGWQGDQSITAAYLKPNARDKNVMPYEMAEFVSENTDLRVVLRVGGDLSLLKSFIAAGIPVIVEKGFEGPTFDGWMGHYEVVNGYDDAKDEFIVQDSYNGPNQKVAYDVIASQWRAFNHTYIVPYPAEREAEVMTILGLDADPESNYRQAAEQAAQEVEYLTGRDLFFAWYNRGTNLMYLKDYQASATAYDAAFANYPSIPEKERPWRMVWYQTGPYFAYYYTGRYQDVISLADTTLSAMSEPILEESYYWRALAKVAIGDTDGAVADLRKSLEDHPGFTPSLQQLDLLGVQP